jgi:ATP-dependent protease ClpP protease subunit
MKEIVINIEGEIGQYNNTVEAIQKEIAPYSGIALKVIVNIRSTGGLLDEALKIYDYLHWLSELPDVIVETRCFGYTASCGTIIAQSASPNMRGISEHSLYLIHCCTCDIEKGNYIGLGKQRDILMLRDEHISKIYAKHSRGVLDEKAVIEIMEENEGEGYWQEPSEVISNGLADFIITPDSSESNKGKSCNLFAKIKRLF